MLKRFIEQLSAEFKLEQTLAPNEDGSYSLPLEPNLNISLSESPESGIRLYAVVCQLPQKNIENFLLQAMSANLFGLETGSSSLGLDKEAKNLVLVNFIPEQLDYREFYEVLEDFVNYADAWSEEARVFFKQEAEQ
ncbi:MAG: type III secretion system chaperone [Chlamydiales bacterium]